LDEAYALMFGLHLAKEANNNSLSIFGDSMVIIKKMNGKSTLGNYELKIIISIIKQEDQSFDNVSFDHIKREINEEADSWEK
jgi:ribonuclease HI